MVLEIITPKREDRSVDVFVHRVEHRDYGQTTVVAHTSDVYARQQELSLHAAQLIAAAATGELVLVEEATGRDVARRSLAAETPASSPFAHNGGKQHDTRGWLGGETQKEPSWFPTPLPNQHRFADVETQSRTSSDCYRRDESA